MEIITLTQLLKFLAALCIVLGLMGGLAILMRKFGYTYTPKTSSSKKRLEVREILALDARRKLAIIRRDQTEHLIILGADGDTVVESGFESPQDGFSTKTENNENS